jgi:2-amino-4-hydroxy-6-hydroxymethyldihydropteridine diphosphokinase
MSIIYLSLGSNINPEHYIPMAINCLRENVEVIQTSSAWQTHPIGSSGSDFINAIVEVNTTLSPQELKEKIIHYIESQLGRIRTANKYADRTIDIDILVVDNKVIDNDIWTYAHLAVPFAEINPEFKHKEKGETINQIAQYLIRTEEVKPRRDIIQK